MLEGRRDLLRELAAASMQNGIGVVAVTRSDGSARVRDVLERASLPAGDTAGPAELIVGRLTAAERQDLVDTFGALNRLSAEARLEWLVGRPGLVDVLLPCHPCRCRDSARLLCSVMMVRRGSRPQR